MTKRLMSTLAHRDITFVRGEGSCLVDEHGKRYLDFFCDVGTSSLGYSDPLMAGALRQMLDQGIPPHAPNLYGFQERDRAATRLCLATGMDRVFFCNSGTEAAEAAIKLARLWQWQMAGGRSRADGGALLAPSKARTTIYTYAGGFHGRTYGALAAGDGPKYHTEGFGPLPEGFKHFKTLDQIDTDAAAIMLAPVFGNNDVQMYDSEWLLQLRRMATEMGALLIFDEVQTGAGRTGRMTYNQRLDSAQGGGSLVEPKGIADIITLAKGIAMGAPVGAMLAREPYGSTFTPGTHFSTFGGNPLGMVFLNGMLDWLERNSMHVGRVGVALMEGIAAMGFKPRGIGLLWAFDCDVDTIALSHACLEEGLLIGAFRAGPGAVKLTPPLNISINDLRVGLDKLNTAYLRVKNKQ